MIAALALFLAAPSAAAEWSVAASSRATLAQETVIVYRGGGTAVPDALASGSEDFSVVSAVEKDGAWDWSVLPLSTGTRSFVARWTAADGKTVAAPAVVLKILEETIEEKADISDIKEPIAARPSPWPWLAALLAAAAAWYGWKKWSERGRAPDGTPLPPEEPPLPPEEAAALAIAELRESGVWAEDKAAYYLRLTEIVRVYLEARYEKPATAMTSAEVARLVKDRAHDLSVGGGVRDLLSRADLVKFARVAPRPDEGERDAELALALIKATTPPAYDAAGSPK